MAIVSISRGSNSFGKEVAEKTAQRLGYRCLARETMLEASDLCSIPQDELEWALDHSPLFFERTVDSKDRYITAVQAALLNQFSQDNVVYHGFAGHYFARDIHHALKVRILAELEDRVSVATERSQISEREARRQLRKKDKAQRRWGLYLYGMDPEDPTLYDIILHVGKMGADGAAEIICTLVQNETFRTTEASCQQIKDLALVASVRVALSALALDVTILDVTATDGEVCVGYRELSGGSFNKLELHRRVHQRTRALAGLKQLRLEQRSE